MSQSKVYLCPSCQSVIRSEKDASEGLTCDACKFSFGGGGAPESVRTKSVPHSMKGIGSASIVRDVMSHREVAEAPALFGSTEKVRTEGSQLPAPREDGKVNRDEETILQDGTRQVKRRKKRRKEEKHRKLYLFITAWIGVIVALFALFQIKGVEDKKRPNAVASTKGLEPWKREFYRVHLKPISVNFNGFVHAASLPAELQFIDRSSNMASKFTRFNQTHSIPSFQGRMALRGQHILELQEDPLVLAVETRWADADGKEAEAVHVWDGKKWRLDWESYAPYSTVPWTLFRSGLGKQEGEFRLLVRKRKTGVESKELTLLFYTPSYSGDQSLEVIRASESSEVIVERRSEIGKKVSKLLADLEKGKRPLESILGGGDPRGMARVKVVLAWGMDKYEHPKMMIKEIKGVSWYGERICEVLGAQIKNGDETKSGLNESASESTVEGDE